LARDRFEVFGLCIESRRHLCEELVESVERRAPCGGADPADRSAASRRSGDRVVAVSDHDLHRVHRNTKRVGDDDVECGSRAGAQILSPHLELDRTVGLNREVAVAGMTQAAPGVYRNSEPTLDRPGRLVSALMPL